MVCVPPSGREATVETTATYTVEGPPSNVLNMEWVGAGRTTGTINSNTFTMKNEGMDFVYQRQAGRGAKPAKAGAAEAKDHQDGSLKPGAATAAEKSCRKKLAWLTRLWSNRGSSVTERFFSGVPHAHLLGVCHRAAFCSGGAGEPDQQSMRERSPSALQFS
jgi:hypothetical protein